MTTDITTSNAGSVTVRPGQATQIEQSRAVAEVQASIVVAQQCPRDVQRAIDDSLQACGRKALAERAFYSFPRGAENVNGPSVYLARELARCWGNVQYGLKELSRDDAAGESQMLAYAWDVQTNTRSESIFIVKHIRDSTDKRTRVKRRDPLVDQRDIYENNANNGARRLREAIMSILPAWYVEEAKDRCWKTLKADTDGKPLPLRIADVVTWFETKHEVSAAQLEKRFGRKRALWTELDVAQAGVLTRSIQRGETTVGEVFPVEVEAVTVSELAGQTMAPDQVPPGIADVLRAAGLAGAEVRVINASDLVHYDAEGNRLDQPAESPVEAPETPDASAPSQEQPAEPERKPRTGRAATAADKARAKVEVPLPEEDWPDVAEPGRH